MGSTRLIRTEDGPRSSLSGKACRASGSPEVLAELGLFIFGFALGFEALLQAEARGFCFGTGRGQTSTVGPSSSASGKSRQDMARSLKFNDRVEPVEKPCYQDHLITESIFELAG